MIKFCLNKAYIAALLLLGCVSCGDPDLFDTDKWSDNIEGLEPNVQLKVAHGSFTLWDLLMDTTGYIQKVPDSQNPADTLLAIKYTEEDIYELDNLSSIFDMSVGNLSFDLPDILVPGDQSGLELIEDLVLDVPEIDAVEVPISDIPAGSEVTGILAAARLDVSIPREDFVYEIQVEFANLLVDGVPFSRTFLIEKNDGSNGTVLNETIELPGVLLNLKEMNGIKMQVSGVIKKGQTISTGITIAGGSVGLSDITFIKAEGKLKAEPMRVEGYFDLDIEFLDKIGGNFRFTDPELKILVKNKGIGVAADLQMDFWVKDGLGANRFNGGPLEFPVNRELTEKEGTMVYRGEELGAFLSLPPSGLVSYAGQVTLGGNDDYSDVIWKGGAVRMDAEINIPLKLSAEGLFYQDTISDVSVDKDVADKIMSGTIVLAATNGVPLELSVDSLILVDKEYRPLTKVAATAGKNKLEAANGNTSAKGQLEFELNKEQAKLLGRTEHMLLAVKAATPLEGGVRKAVSVYANASLELNVMLKAQVKLDNFDF